jgi:zinc transport system permease protein
MAGAAVGIGAASVVAGLSGSLHADLPAGPAIVVAAVALFALAVILRGPAPVRR